VGLTLVTGPTQEPVALAEAKAHMRVSISEDDGIIAGYVLAARNYLEQITGRAFLTQTWDYTIDYGMGWISNWQSRYAGSYIEVPKSPLQSVTTISYVDDNGVTQTLASSQYVVDGSTTIGTIRPAYNVSWPSARWQPASVTVRFVAGWTTNFPDSLRQAILLLAGQWYEHREIVSDVTAELPMVVASLIAPYKVYY
jgi:uncharacterized phiE125 gp8 family phage protein